MEEIDIFKAYDKIDDYDDFKNFIEIFFKHYQKNKNNLEEWENNNLESFLDGLSGFANNLNGYINFHKLDYDLKSPTWKLFADILIGAIQYE